jgi:hypothetical protein
MTAEVSYTLKGGSWEVNVMWTLLVSATIPMPAGDVTLEILPPDVNAVLPLAILCIASVLCTAVWFLAVSTCVIGRHDTMV